MAINVPAFPQPMDFKEIMMMQVVTVPSENIRPHALDRHIETLFLGNK